MGGTHTHTHAQYNPKHFSGNFGKNKKEKTKRLYLAFLMRIMFIQDTTPKTKENEAEGDKLAGSG